MAFLLPATVVSITEVLLVISAASVVWSTLLPLASFTSMPNSSMKAPRVPEPSSREMTVILPVMPVSSTDAAEEGEDASPPVEPSLVPLPELQPTRVVTPSMAAISKQKIFFILI